MKIIDMRPHTVVVPYNGKIADINEADTAKHTLDLETALSETRKIVSILLYVTRITGTGRLVGYPNEGTGSVWIFYDAAQPFAIQVIIKDATQRLQYSQTAANDDFDLYCMGYLVSV